MSLSFLDQFKKKPTPTQKKSIAVFLSSRSNDEPVKIIDKSKEDDFNREDFLKKIRNVKNVQNKREVDDIPVVVEELVERKEKTHEPSVEEEKVEEEIIERPEIEKVQRPKKKAPRKISKKGKIKLAKSTLSFATKKIEKEVEISKLKLGDIIRPKMNLKKEEVIIVSDYYMNNREMFVNFINSVFQKHKDEIMEEEQNEEKKLSCERKEDAFSLLTHQKIVRDYMNLNTPYRGLLLYHGLGSGKTCSSIAIAEGLKNKNRVIIMTPASLRPNYIEELKKCGDHLYKKSQYWEFIRLVETDENKNTDYINSLTKIMHLKPSYVKKRGGIWFVDVTKPKNYDSLSTYERESLDEQLNEMIGKKYNFINYNGLRSSHLDKLTNNGQINPFSNSVVIIDEAHNFVSRIVNKLSRKKALSLDLYEYLMNAENCKIVFLSGTPIINYPNEIGVMFNMLRGYIKTIKIPLQIQTSRKINEESIKKMLDDLKLLDYIEYKPSQKTLVVTRNPFGFVSNYTDEIYKGVRISQNGSINDNELIKILTTILEQNDIKVLSKNISYEKFKALPDDMDMFKNMFIKTVGNTPQLQNENLFKRRIIGLSSYFRSAQEQLMPRFNKDTDYIVEKIPMSLYQFSIYESARQDERKLEEASKKRKKMQKKDDIFKETTSTYRIFSRAFCNFVFPENISRPMPNEDKDLGDTLLTQLDEDMLDNASAEEKIENTDGRFEVDELEEIQDNIDSLRDMTYEKRIINALKKLKKNSKGTFSPDKLKIYSPKFLRLLENIENPENRGKHLIYSQFRTLEGIGIFKLVMEENGYVEFKIEKVNEQWTINIKEEDIGKPTFALYTGTESSEEKEIIRNIFNGNWGSIPSELSERLRQISSNNNYGEIIKIFMITASGAEGISLTNVRFVHLLEPYWHPVRLEQVIGRARRICSHNSLPEKDRTVNVFLYLMTFSEEILKDATIELKLKDKGLSTDEYLFETSNKKLEINELLLKAIKETSVDCGVHNRSTNKESLTCFAFSSNDPNKYSFMPSISEEQSDKISNINVKKITWKARLWTAPNGKKYAVNPDDKSVYDLDSYKIAIKNKSANPILVGKIITKDGKTIFKQM